MGDEVAPFVRLRKLGGFRHKVARFRQVNKDRPAVHHDALEFPDGQLVLVTRLCEGQKATVLQLPAIAGTTTQVGEQNRVTYVG